LVYVKQVTLTNGNTRWAVKDSATGRTVRNPYGPGAAYFDSKKIATGAIEDCVMALEQESM